MKIINLSIIFTSKLGKTPILLKMDLTEQATAW